MNPHSSMKTNKPTFSALKAHDLKLQTHIDAACDHLDFVDISSALRNKNKSLDNDFVVVSNRPEIMIYLELISSTRDNRTLRSAMTYKIHASLTITNLNSIHLCIRVRLNIKVRHFQYCALCAPMDCNRKLNSQIFLPYRSVMANAVSQTFDSKKG